MRNGVVMLLRGDRVTVQSLRSIHATRKNSVN
jgi:hypothetical protein